MPSKGLARAGASRTLKGVSAGRAIPPPARGHLTPSVRPPRRALPGVSSLVRCLRWKEARSSLSRRNTGLQPPPCFGSWPCPALQEGQLLDGQTPPASQGPVIPGEPPAPQPRAWLPSQLRPPRILAAPQPCLSELLPREELGGNVCDGAAPRQGRSMVPVFTGMMRSLPPPQASFLWSVTTGWICLAAHS